jgi:tripartite-type tricarboxylate transporter receptor subunit TctC
MSDAPQSKNAYCTIRKTQVLFASVPGMLSEKSDRLCPIAMVELKRSALLPDLPTTDEQGLKGFEVANWAGLLGPAGLDPAILRKLHCEILSILDAADVKNRIETLGFDMLASTPEQLGTQDTRDVARWSEVVERANVPMN